jgi:beta-N-acetylhexosaminidase
MINHKNPSLEQKIAQMIVLGFSGPTIKDHPSILKEVRDLGIGGLIIFDRDMVSNKPVNNVQDPHQLKALIAEAQAQAEIPLFITIDQEGGRVARLRLDKGFMEFPSHKKLGEINDTNYTYEISLAHARMLKWLGVNVNYGPVVDIAVNLDNPIVHGKERSFSANVETVKEQALAFSKAMLDEGILNCLKHFPGHGSSTTDSHLGMTDITDTWTEEELEPYKYLIEEDACAMVMLGHLMLKQFDKELPSSLSKPMVDALLKEKLGYNGLITTDDLQMRALSDHYNLKEILVMAINAGSDMVIFGNNLLPEYISGQRIIDTLLGAISEGLLTEERINESYERIIAAKQKHLA